MTQIDFYILPDDTQVEPVRYTCRLIEKVYRLGHKIYVHCANETQCRQVDETLWQLDDASFIPHSRLSESATSQNNVTPASAADNSPILIGWQALPEYHGEVLINLADSIPDFFSRFHRVAEIVPGNMEQRTKSRQNYRFYKERGYPLNTHNIKPSKR